jgi:hypothetical protein
LRARSASSVFKPGTNPDDVAMSDVLCDFCGREWTEDVPFIEGHRGRHVCGRCLELARAELAGGAPTGDVAPAPYTCVLCREDAADRAALRRANEPGWRSPIVDDAVMCRRCAEEAAAALAKDPDWQ